MKHADWLKDQLKNDEFAAHYLTQAAQDLEPGVFIAALRHVVDARGGLAKVADVGKLSKASLYKAIPHSGKGNPTARTMFAALRASGLNLTFTVADTVMREDGRIVRKKSDEQVQEFLTCSTDLMETARALLK